MLKPQTKIVGFPTGEPVFAEVIVDRHAFCDLADAVFENIKELGLPSKNEEEAKRTLTTMKFCACFNREFRNETYKELEELMYELYERVNG